MDFFFEGGRQPGNKIYGVVVGIVVDNNHPDGEYRVKVKFPWLPKDSAGGEMLSNWARISTFMSGKERGAFWLPEVDDEVLVAFEHGDIRWPIVIGNLWNGKDKTLHDSQGGKNDFRTIRSRTGCVVEFVDQAGKEKIILQTTIPVGKVTTTEPKGRGGLYVVIDNDAKKIEISDDAKKNYICLDSKNQTITLECEKDIILKAGQNIKMEAKGANLETKSGADTKMESGANMKQKAGANMDLEASGNITEKGATINLN
jgi:uncharacterized protein involved in type VI secretion and phage assembly